MEDLNRLDNKNTLKKTKFDLRIIESYLAKVQEARGLLRIPVGELDEHLANFIVTHRKQDGSEYEPGTLRGILGSLDRHFEKSNYTHAIYRSKETKFQKTVKAMKAKQSYLKTIGKGNHPNQAEPLTEREIELLYSTGTIGLHSPTALLHMLFFNIGLHFSLRTMEQHSLKWGDINLKADPQGRKYLEHTKKLAPSRTSGKLHPCQTMRMQIYESPEQPERDVVRAYEKYSSERPEKMKCKDAPFYLTPQSDCRPGYARWFKNLPMGETRIRGIMKNLKAAAGLSPQKKITNHSAMKTSSLRGGPGALRGGPPRAKVKRSRQPLIKDCRGKSAFPEAANGSNGHVAVKIEGASSRGPGVLSGTEAQYSGGGRANRPSPAFIKEEPFRGGSAAAQPRPGPAPAQPSYIAKRKCRKIKEEWHLEPETNPEVEDTAEEKSFSPGQVSVTFHDVAACFSAEEWGLLGNWQKDLYTNVMKEIHSAMQAMGYTIVNSDVLLKIKDDEVCRKGRDGEKDSNSDHGVSPDILLRIKQDDVPDWRDLGEPGKEEELDSPNSSIPVFDPDLSLWIFREEPDLSSSEETKEQILTSDAEEEADSSHSVPPLYKEPASEIPTLYNPTYPESSRPGKRKRRPPQRRSNEQRPDTDDEGQAESQHRLPCRNPSAEEHPDWTPHERLYQCDLCEKSYSARSSPLRTLMQGSPLTCPQCGGNLSLHPLYSRAACTEIEVGFAQTLRFSDHVGDTGYAHLMQGPVG
ncbi:uncharacterized protein LOC142492555 isoform X2 [Ascaphus truei]|uniref:uncharacterized protein LOC142492555 isoform X2 n=1 Tax=Ascaphus truei TaxID=8439 RepID=UPI003F59EFA5